MKYVGVSTPAWTLGVKRKKVDFRSDSAPINKYEWEKSIDKISPRSPTYLQYKADRPNYLKEHQKEEDDKLGPGTYDVAEGKKKEKKASRKKKKHREHQFFLTSSPRFKEAKIWTYACPTTYKVKHPDTEPIQKSFGYKDIVEAKPDCELGPGQYNPIHKFVEKERAHSFSKALHSKILDQVLNSKLGPGHYDILNSEDPKRFHSRKGTMGFGKRQVCSNRPSRNTSLGPGSYDDTTNTISHNMLSTKKHPLLQRFYTKKEGEQRPAPGQYEINTGLNLKRAGFIGTSKRQPLDPVNDNPAPNYYEIVGSFKTSEKDQPNSTFGSAERKASTLLQNFKNPGPGDYDPMKPRAHLPNFTLKGKFKPPKIESYFNGRELSEDKFNESATKPRIIKGASIKRPFDDLIKRKAEEPGPADYNPDVNTVMPDSSQYGIKFTRATRNIELVYLDDEIALGPGKYNLMSTIPQLQPHECIKVQDLGMKALLDGKIK